MIETVKMCIRDSNMAIYKEQMVLRDLDYAIIDEVDSVLIDEARTPLILSLIHIFPG